MVSKTMIHPLPTLLQRMYVYITIYIYLLYIIYIYILYVGKPTVCFACYGIGSKFFRVSWFQDGLASGNMRYTAKIVIDRSTHCFQTSFNFESGRLWECVVFTDVASRSHLYAYLKISSSWGHKKQNLLCTSINGNFRILNWRYLPYIRPIFQA